MCGRTVQLLLVLIVTFDIYSPPSNKTLTYVFDLFLSRAENECPKGRPRPARPRSYPILFIIVSLSSCGHKFKFVFTNDYKPHPGWISRPFRGKRLFVVSALSGSSRLMVSLPRGSYSQCFEFAILYDRMFERHLRACIDRAHQNRLNFTNHQH